jgi:hypothetical protein
VSRLELCPCMKANQTSPLPSWRSNKETSSKERKWRILTPIDEAVVILLICLVAIPFFLEHDPGYTFGAAIRVILNVDFTQWTDGSLEKFLHERIEVRAYSDVYTREIHRTFTWTSFTSTGRLDTTIFSTG